MNPFLKRRTPLLTITVCLCLLFSGAARAQESDLVAFLNSGKEDASKLMKAYLNPVVVGLSYGINGGWAQTAKAHKTLGFDLGVSVNAVFIPSSQNYFDPTKLGLKTLTNFTTTSPNGLAPTLVGPKYGTNYQSSIDTDGDGKPDQTLNFKGPEGLDFKKNIGVSGVVAPTATLGIGIYKNTDLKIRWMPQVGAGDSKIKLIGFGVMHDIKQHIPGVKLLPFDLSVLAAFTKITGTTSFKGGPLPPADGDTNPQRINYSMNAWLVQALISKKFSVITLYGGVGYNAVKTTSDVLGSYVVYDDKSVANKDLILRDPVSMTFKNNGFRATAGFRLKLAVLCLSADYTVQKYNMLSIGLGVAVR